jgi:hypothetical protein
MGVKLAPICDITSFMDRHAPEEISPEAKQWAAPIREQWKAIYDKFIADTTALIEQAGGTDYVRVSAYGGEHYHQLGLHLDRLGRLGERARSRAANLNCPASMPG